VDTAFELVARVAAALVTGARVVVSVPPGIDSAMLRWLETLAESCGLPLVSVVESDGELVARIQQPPVHDDGRIRFASPASVPAGVRAAPAGSGVYLADESVLAEGRVELLWYLREQSISHDFHRYCNPGIRAGESRREPV
jgi:RHH-type proline utilization regulon transcriptional repressor/proline dehydrogenase/delta 1-pyrroline-5-carboxylate dehydrogenase